MFHTVLSFSQKFDILSGFNCYPDFSSGIPKGFGTPFIESLLKNCKKSRYFTSGCVVSALLCPYCRISPRLECLISGCGCPAGRCSTRQTAHILPADILRQTFKVSSPQFLRHPDPFKKTNGNAAGDAGKGVAVSSLIYDAASGNQLRSALSTLRRWTRSRVLPIRETVSLTTW